MDSIWTKTVIASPFPALEEDAKTDVLIIGGGMAGVLCAYQLQQAGVDCLLVEAGRIGSGVTKNTTAKITAQHGFLYQKLLQRFGREKTALYLQANQNALQQYRQLCNEIPCGFLEQPNFVYSLYDPYIVERELEALGKLPFYAVAVSDLPLPFPTAGAVKFPKQAQFHPLMFLQGIAQGLPIRENTRVLELKGTTAVTTGGTVRAKKIIIATHFPILNKHGMYFLKMYQHRSYVMALDGVKEISGMYVDESGTGLSLRMHDGMLLLGGGAHRTGKPGGGYAVLEQEAQRYFPGCEIKYRWATQDCMTLDAMPYIGRYSGSTHDLYVATGFNKWGMTGAMTAATVLRDLILGKDSPYGDLFSPSRSMLRPQLLMNAAESAANLLTPTAPRCPHLGCALKWNRQEHTWDCPCHGSRFTETGTLLDGPATADLKKRD